MISTNPVSLPAVAREPASLAAIALLRRASVPAACAALAGGVGGAVLLGWLAGSPGLRALGPSSHAATNPMAALCFLGLAVALGRFAIAESDQRAPGVWGLTLAVATVGILRLAGEFYAGVDGIDTVLFRQAMASTGDGRDNRMATAAALNFTLLASALLLLSRRVKVNEALAQVLAVGAFAQAQVALLGHVYRSGWFSTLGQFNRMALPTSIAFSLLAVGVLALRRDSGVLAAVQSEGPGGTLARRLLPAGFLAPAVLGWIAIRALHLSDRPEQPALVVMLFAVAMILVFVGLIAWNATRMHETHRQRTRAEAALRESEARFRLLAENGSDVVSLYDARGRVLYISPSSERVLGFTPDDVARMAPFAMVHPEDADRLRRHFDELMRGAAVSSLACRMLHKTGRVLWLEMMWRAIVDGEGRVVQIQASSRDVTERKEYERQLEDARRKLQVHHESLLEANARLAALASHDGLTGLKNRRAFEERMTEELARLRRTRQSVALLLLDIDHFKSFNDSFGHPRGDEVLRQVARHLTRSIRDSDLAVRYGGEEFAVILPNTDASGALEIAERLRSAIAGAQWSERLITASVGVALATAHTVTLPELLEHADRALYRSKQDGRNRVTLADAE